MPGIFFQEPSVANHPTPAPLSPQIQFQQTANSGLLNPEIPLSFHFTPLNVTIAVLVVLFSIWVVLMNVLIIIGVLKKHELHPADYYLINLGVMDAVIGLVVIPLMGTVRIIGSFPFGDIVCHVWIFIDYFLIVASAMAHCVLLLNILWMVRFPGAYKHDKRTHFCVITLMWAVSLICWLPPFLNNLGRDYPLGFCGYSNTYNHYYTLSIGIVGFFLPLLVSIISATYSTLILRKKRHERLFYARPLKLKCDEKTSPVRTRHWSRAVIFETNDILMRQSTARKHFPLVLYLLVLFIVCRISFYTYFGVGAFVARAFPPDLSNGIFWIMHANSGLSPIIHILVDSDLRNEIYKMFCGKRTIHPQLDLDNKNHNSTAIVSKNMNGEQLP